MTMMTLPLKMTATVIDAILVTCRVPGRSAGGLHCSYPSVYVYFIRAAVFCGVLLSLPSPGTPRPYTNSKPCAYERTREGIFSADCSGRGITEVPTNLPNAVTSLNLNKNTITVLKNKSFVGVPLLQVLSMTSNSLKFVEKCAFCSVPLLKTISLDRNKLSSLPNGVFSTNQQVEIIQLSSNKFTSIPVGAFNNLKKADLIILSKNMFQRLDFSGFPPMNVSILELTATNVSTISKGDFEALSKSHINEFKLSDINLVKINDGVFQHLKFVRKMNLPYYGVYNFSLNSFVGMTSLEEVSVTRGGKMKRISGFSTNTSLDIPPLKNMTLSSNRLHSLPSDVFVGLSDLIFLDLYACGITYLENNSFRGLISLEILDLSGNLLSSVNGEIFLHLPMLHTLKLLRNRFKILNPSQFRGLKRLRVLDLSGNSVNTIIRSTWDLPALETLDLSTNNLIFLQYVQTSLFRGLNGLDQLILSSNPIKEIGTNSLLGLDSLKSLDISKLGILQNLVFCFKYSNNLLSLDMSYSTLRTLVRTFQGLISLQYLKVSHMNLLSTGLFSNNISAFSFTPNLTSLSLKGNNLNGMHSGTFTRLIRLTSLDLSIGRINSLHPDIFIELISLRILYLDHNSITSILSQHFRSLHSLVGLRLQTNQLTGVLDKDLFKYNVKLFFVALSNNDLTSVARFTFLPMKFLDLSENPLLCTCDLQWFRQYLDINNMSLNNPNKTICSQKSVSGFAGKRLLDFFPNQVCGPNLEVYISTSLLILTFLAVSGLAYQNRWWLNYKCFHIQLLVVGYDELVDGREHLDYDYDINIIFPDNDEAWAKDNFLDTLMKHAPNFDRDRIVCGEDDLPLMGFRMDAIDYVIENSFKTLVIVTNASVNDAHFLTQLQMTVEHMNEVQLEKVVMVFREDIPDNQLPYLVRLFLSKNKPYFRWTDDQYGQRLFWEKLVKIMRCNKKMNGLLPI